MRGRASEPKEPDIAIEGKTSRVTHSEHGPAIHIVSAWLSEAGLVIGRSQTRAKSNEITEIPKLFRSLESRGTTVTIVAMGCQVAIAESIVKQGGHNLLAVKENEPALYAAIEAVFDEVDAAAEHASDLPPLPEFASHSEVTVDHGRVETRTVRVFRQLEHSAKRGSGGPHWHSSPASRARKTATAGRTSLQRERHIGSRPTADAARIAVLIRAHWSIENGVHYVLDVAFHEDVSRHRTKDIAASFTTMRHIATKPLKLEAPCKPGVVNKRKNAGLSVA